MDELFKSIQEKYIEDITKQIPIHRVLTLIFAMVIIQIYKQNTSNGFVDALKCYSLSDVFDLEKGLIIRTTIYELFLSIISLIVTIKIYSLIKSSIFALLTKTSSYQKHIDSIKSKIELKKSSSTNVNLILASELDIEISNARKKLFSYHVYGEALMTSLFFIAINFSNLKSNDWLLFSISVVAVLYFNFSAFKFYIIKFIPYYAAQKALIGGVAKLGDE